MQETKELKLYRLFEIYICTKSDMKTCIPSYENLSIIKRHMI